MEHAFFMDWFKISNSLTANNHAFNCISNNLVILVIKNELITDYSPNRDDVKHIFKYKSNIVCQDNGQLPGKGGHKRCYNITKCVFTD